MVLFDFCECSACSIRNYQCYPNCWSSVEWLEKRSQHWIPNELCVNALQTAICEALGIQLWNIYANPLPKIVTSDKPAVCSDWSERSNQQVLSSHQPGDSPDGVFLVVWMLSAIAGLLPYTFAQWADPGQEGSWDCCTLPALCPFCCSS